MKFNRYSVLHRLAGVALAVGLTLSLVIPASASTNASTAVGETAAKLIETTPEPTVGSACGEWVILGLSRADAEVPDGYYEGYQTALFDSLDECGGVLSERKYTDYSRIVLAATAIGLDAADLGGYNLLLPLADYNKVTGQGLNGAIFALLALDSGAYEIPDNPNAEVQATRELYLSLILSAQLEDGGWAYSGTEADADVTAQALQSIAAYSEQENVSSAIKRGVAALSAMQNEDGSFSTRGTPTAESCAQVIVALTALGIDPDSDSFTKQGVSVVDALLSFELSTGGFCHTAGSLYNQMATEQAFCALTALQRFHDGKTALYDMTDLPSTERQKQNETEPSKKAQTERFSDVAPDSWYYSCVYEAVERGLFSGMGNGLFAPNVTMSRGMVVTVLYSLSGAEASGSAGFADVADDAWYAEPIAWAVQNGIASGYGGGLFGPNDPVTREQFTLFLERFAQWQGRDTTDKAGLSGYSDAASISSYAVESMAWSVQNGLITGRPGGILAPKDSTTRAEAAAILCSYEKLA